MGTVICQHCEKTLMHVEGEKVARIYMMPKHCHNCHINENHHPFSIQVKLEEEKGQKQNA
nr:GapA-binding peptide SR1P [Alkalihalobacillus trypoxylicola]